MAVHDDHKAQIELKGIELLSSSINLPLPQMKVDEFKFSINLECKADARNKLIFVIVAVDVKNEDQSFLFGSLTVTCIFSILNFENVVQYDVQNKLHIPMPVLDMLNTIAMSTVRGIMFCTFKGTFLHNAFLPVIKSEQLHESSSEDKSKSKKLSRKGSTKKAGKRSEP